MKLTATVERASDGTFTAVAVIAEHTMIADGDTRDEALNSLRDGVSSLVETLKSEGKSLPEPSIELVSIEVAA